MSVYDALITYNVDRSFLLDVNSNIIPVGELADISGVKTVVYIRSNAPLSTVRGKEFRGSILVISKGEEDKPLVPGQKITIVSPHNEKFIDVGAALILPTGALDK